MANITRRNEAALAPTSGWDPFEVMREMLRFDPLRQLGLTGPNAAGLQQIFVPQFEVKESANKYIFKADLPGLSDKDVEISLDQNRLTVSGHREAEKRDESDHFYAYERSYGSFTRSFTLPVGIDANHVNADLRDGVLTIEIPKAPEHQPKKIEIKPIAGGGTVTAKGAKAQSEH